MAPKIDEKSPEEKITAALEKLSDLEKDFAEVELDALRHREYSLQNLYTMRQAAIDEIPNFWSIVLTNGPDELHGVFNEYDAMFLEALRSVKVERPGIKSGTQGEPRNLKFTFRFDKNDLFEDSVVIKIFEFHPGLDGGALVSVPVNFKWTKEAKKQGVNKLLDLASELFQVEKNFNAGDITEAERENLWQGEKLREALEEAAEDGENPGFLNWFGYRGLRAMAAAQSDQDPHHDDEDSDDFADLEIFPDGDDIAMILAEELWPNVMDYFVRAQDSDSEIDDLDEEDEDEDNEEEAPALVQANGSKEANDADADDEKEAEKDQPPKKRAKRS